MTKFLCTVQLSGDNLFNCNFCSAKRPASLHHKFVRLGQFLIIQLKRFSNFHGTISKDLTEVICYPKPLSLSVEDGDDVSFTKNFVLVATINHSGSLSNGHYWAYIRCVDQDSWFHCNDRAVVQCDSEVVNNNSSYLLFYQEV